MPEVETVRRGLAPSVEGQTITRADIRRKDLRFPFPERFRERLEGRVVASLGRRAKYLLADLDDGEVLVMHLGMSGSFRVEEAQPADFHHRRSRDGKHDHVVLALSNGASITYNDPRRFGFMTLVPRAEIESHAFFAELGPEPVGNALSAEYLVETLAKRGSPIKASLLDQTIIAGLGNIYVCEALFRAQINPTRKAGQLTSDEIATLVPIIREVIAEAIEAGGSSLRDHAQVSGELGYFQHRFKVYDREGEPCPLCGTGIARITQSGRSTFFCPTCQAV